MKRYQRLNPSYARIKIDPKAKTASFTYPLKSTTFEMLLIGFFQIWIRIFFVFMSVNVALFLMYGIGYYASHGTPVSASSGPTDGTVIIVLVILGSLIGLIILPPIITSLIFMWNENLLRIYPEIYTRFCKFLDGYKYIRIRKLKSKVYEVPWFDNTFMDVTVTGEFKKYFIDFKIDNHRFKNTIKHWRTGKTKSEECLDYWYAVFTFSKIPQKGYLEIEFL